MKHADGLTVAVTGASGYLGTRLIRTLCSDERIDRVLGFDLGPPQFKSDKFIFDVVDVRDKRLSSRLSDVDVIVHLASVMDPIHDEAVMRDINVNGSQNVFIAAADAGVGKIVYSSSATVYGAHPDNDVPLTEESPLRANLDFSYAAHKLEVEYVVKEFRAEHPSVIFTLLRPAIVFGAGVDNAWSHFMEAPLLFGVKGHSPPWQFVHEDDVASGAAFAIFNDLNGAYNLAPRGWLENDEAAELIGRSRAELSESTAFSVMDRLWRAGLAEAPAGMLHYVMHPWVLSADKLTKAGFICEHSNAGTLTEALSHIRPFVRIGRSRFRRTSLKRATTLVAAALLASSVAATRRTRP